MASRSSIPLVRNSNLEFARLFMLVVLFMQLISCVFAGSGLVNRQVASATPTSTNATASEATRSIQPAVKTTSLCEPAIHLGLTLITSPNSTLRILAGSNVTVSWKFSSNGDYEVRLPMYLDIQWQFVGEKTSRWDPTSKQLGWVATRVALDGQDSLVWTTDRDMRDGWYRMRILPDGKDFYARPPPCFGDYDVMPGMSASFFIGTSRIDGESSNAIDTFGPSSAAHSGKHVVVGLLGILAIALSL